MASHKDYYGSRAFEEAEERPQGNFSKSGQKEEDYVRNYSITNNLSEELGSRGSPREQVSQPREPGG